MPSSIDSIERLLELPPEKEFRHNIAQYVRHLSAARVRGDSMMYRDIYDGDVIIFRSSGFDYVEHNRVVVIEKIGEEEGFGSWALKRLVIERPGASRRNEFGDEIESDNPDVKLYSYNIRIRPWQLDPSGQYKIRGVLVRSMRPQDVRLVDIDCMRSGKPDEESMHGVAVRVCNIRCAEG